MTPAGWFIMALSVGGVVFLFLWCIKKVLTTPRSEEAVHGFEGDLPDTESDSSSPKPGQSN